MSHAVDSASERTPPAVAAMRNFKNKLLQGHQVNASQFGIVLPAETTKSVINYDDENMDTQENIGADVSEDEFQDPDDQGPMKQFDTKELIKKDAAQLLVEYLEQTAAKEDIKIVGPFGKIGFKAINVSVTDFGVAVIIKKDAIQFEPNINTDLIIQYRGQDYSVVYAGGFFTFPKIPFTFVSFIRAE